MDGVGMKTPIEAVAEALQTLMHPDLVAPNEPADVIKALDAAGYVIVEKMPPNTIMIVTTDEQGCIVRFEQKGETFSFDPAKP